MGAHNMFYGEIEKKKKKKKTISKLLSNAIPQSILTRIILTMIILG